MTYGNFGGPGLGSCLDHRKETLCSSPSSQARKEKLKEDGSMFHFSYGTLEGGFTYQHGQLQWHRNSGLVRLHEKRG